MRIQIQRTIANYEELNRLIKILDKNNCYTPSMSDDKWFGYDTVTEKVHLESDKFRSSEIIDSLEYFTLLATNKQPVYELY